MVKATKKWWPIFVLPTFAAFIIGFIVPFCEGLYLSFCKFTTINKAVWIGASNYVKVFQDPQFFTSLGFTALFTVFSTVLINVFAFAVALALTNNIKGTNVFRTIFFMPNLIGGIVLGYIWNILFNCLLSLLAKPLLALNITAGFWGMIVLMCWQQIGYMMIIYIAGLQAVPGDMLEAAKIDGASEWKTLWHITIPNVMPSITICTFLTLTNSFKLYDQNLALTNGRPYLGDIHTTEMLALNIVNSNTLKTKGVGQAKAVIFFILVAVIGILQMKSTHDKEVQQ